MKKKYLLIVISSMSLLADDIDNQVAAIEKSYKQQLANKTFDDMYDDIKNLIDLYFNSRSIDQEKRVRQVIQDYLNKVEELTKNSAVAQTYGRAIQNFLKGIDGLLKEDDRVISDTEIFSVLNKAKNNIYVSSFIATVPSTSTPPPLPPRPSVPLTPETGALVPYIDVTKPRPTPGVYEEYEDVERIIPVGTRPGAQPYTATITPGAPVTQDQLNTELRRLQIRVNWLRRSMPS